MRLPKGEETLPIIVVEGRMLTLEELRRLYPELYETLIGLRRQGLGLEFEITDELLIERMRRRIAQGRVQTIYSLSLVEPELTPEEQLRHMEMRDQIGLELIGAERKLLGEELRLLRGG
ncbi:unnamed protein product [marine sediment metagenome]|uniref:Uncharacterized protein n=1 Tax=marine sediment metagenome TaxID=412755 RepID=X1N056_9ZZZZ